MVQSVWVQTQASLTPGTIMGREVARWQDRGATWKSHHSWHWGWSWGAPRGIGGGGGPWLQHSFMCLPASQRIPESGVPLWCSGLRTWYCHSCGSHSISGLGTSIGCGCAPPPGKKTRIPARRWPSRGIMVVEGILRDSEPSWPPGVVGKEASGNSR